MVLVSHLSIYHLLQFLLFETCGISAFLPIESGIFYLNVEEELKAAFEPMFASHCFA